MSDSGKFLDKMLDRLYASLLSGPGLNCRPHASRQRIDLSLLGRLQDVPPETVILQILGDQHHIKLSAKVPSPRRDSSSGTVQSGRRSSGKILPPTDVALTPEEAAAQTAWEQQQALLNKLRGIVEDARLYTQDTGAHVLYVGFPLLSVPAGKLSSRSGATRRILAPVAFIPIQITAKSGLSPSLRIDCYGEGADLVIPNTALLAWLEQQTGKSTVDLFADEDGVDPWREIRELVAYVCQALSLPVPALWNAPTEAAPPSAQDLKLSAVPKAEENDEPGVLCAAVLGLFPMANQSLIRDTQDMSAQSSLSGPVVSFLLASESLAGTKKTEASPARYRRVFAEEHLVSAADPFQSQAVRLAREHSGLVIHGPPGTGKSQTIANIIGDHLARGERVLMVCDKRTALDVVANRLQHLGLGGLYALVHDPQRDKRDLYKRIREQLDNLAEAPIDSACVTQLAKVDHELQELHGALSSYYQALHGNQDEQGTSFHTLVGQWLALRVPDQLKVASDALTDAVADAHLDDLERHEHLLRELFERGQSCDWPINPWAACAGISLSEFMGKSLDRWRTSLAEATQAAEQVGVASATIPAFDSKSPVGEQGKARLAIAEQLSLVAEQCSQSTIQRWGHEGLEVVKRAQHFLTDADPSLKILGQGALDAELVAAVRDSLPLPSQVKAWVITLDSYLEVATKWYSFVYLARKGPASEALSCFGLTLAPDNAQRLKQFLTGLQARLTLLSLVEQLTGEKPPSLPSDENLTGTLKGLNSLFDLLVILHTSVSLASVRPLVSDAIAVPAQRNTVVLGLQQSVVRAEAVGALAAKLSATGLFTAAWLSQIGRQMQQGMAVHPQLAPLGLSLPTLENVLRLRDGLGELPASIRQPMLVLLRHTPSPEQGLLVLRHAVLASEMGRHIRQHPQLHSLDAQRLQRYLERYQALDAEKKQLTCQGIVQLWRLRQRAQLLATTGTRLNSLGTELRRRLMLRGEHAMRLRQVIHTGQSIAGGDPLFEVCPVWMASPETVAQIFPRIDLFDVVIFDEASQCRLEEALPVLLRAKRVVIAGDPQQLPPSRFFESAISVSHEEEPDTEQDLFEQQQSEIEDLLNAALNLEIQQCYLDVHYRSRDADLIEFSNEHFYESRLQPIPAYPSRQAKQAAIQLHHAQGTYVQQRNEKEAELVCQLVRQLLMQDHPPSIGVACFNVSQRDLILDCIDRVAAEDPDFAARLTVARNRIGAGSFDGLFVKNLENVQGDERDHMIISTTYGPDASGRFFRRFGPLGRSGGGRRLNVLVTRAREAVHVITSIPPTVYRSLPALPAGSAPGGAFLLFAYLQYAEAIAAPEAQNVEAAPTGKQEEAAAIHVQPSAYPSQFAQALGNQLATQLDMGSRIHWGNDGFCVDLALQHPVHPEDISVGLLCDGPRFAKAPDAVEWDIFRMTILERQGWKLRRVWTPHFFRDPSAGIQLIHKQAKDEAA